MEKWLVGRVAGQKRWTQRLLSLRIDAPAGAYEAGQFVKLALEVDGERVARPYSFVNPPGVQPLEFYYNIVAEGPLTPRLARLDAGDPVFVANNPSGFLVLSEVPASEQLWMIATGTGLAPFLAILGTETPWERYRKVVLVHAVRTADELVYRELLDEVGRRRAGQFAMVPFVSREACDFALAGRVPAAIRDARLDKRAGVALSAAASQVMLCGNPDMVMDVITALAERGMKKHRRRSPGQITVENYW
jgi:ferredoxin--NADP+ reductase